MKEKWIIAVFAILVIMCGCSNDEGMVASQYDLKASELKALNEQEPKVIKDIAGYKSLFKDEASTGKCDIDFKNKELIVCGGVATGNIASINRNIEERDGVWYISVEIETGIAAVMEPWCVAYLVPKNNGNNQYKTEIRYN